jgi:gamma-glutamylcyclotransferase (GGCT)/AIG2-like uncharacterized protein YtfP
MQHLFVYGLLRPGMNEPMGRFLERNARLMGKGRVRGRLYLVADYPGLVSGAAPTVTVIGDVYALRDPVRVLRELDDYEGCAPASPPPHEYVRRIRPVTLGAGRRLPAWVYLYNRSVRGLRLVPGGDFMSCDVRLR